MFNKISKQFIKFCVIGVFATVINYVMFFLLLHYAKAHYLIASATGFLLGVVAGFPFNKSWTFNAQGSALKQFMPYLLLYMVSLILSLVLLKIQVSLNVDVRLANFFCICFTTCTNFIGTKFLIFRKTVE